MEPKAKDPFFTVVEILLAAAASRPVVMSDISHIVFPEAMSAFLIFLVAVICG